MKNIAAFVFFLFFGLPALAQQPAQAPTQTAGVKETLGNLWGRLRAVTPRSASARAPRRASRTSSGATPSIPWPETRRRRSPPSGSSW